MSIACRMPGAPPDSSRFSSIAMDSSLSTSMSAEYNSGGVKAGLRCVEYRDLLPYMLRMKLWASVLVSPSHSRAHVEADASRTRGCADSSRRIVAIGSQAAGLLVPRRARIASAVSALRSSSEKGVCLKMNSMIGSAPRSSPISASARKKTIGNSGSASRAEPIAGTAFGPNATRLSTISPPWV